MCRRGLVVASCLAFSLALLPASAHALDPVRDPTAHGCQRNPAGLLTFTSPEWVFVGGQASLGHSLQEVRGSASLVLLRMPAPAAETSRWERFRWWLRRFFGLVSEVGAAPDVGEPLWIRMEEHRRG